MIFTSESGLTDAGRIPEWDEWYLGHLAAMIGVPGVLSAQRFRLVAGDAPPSLAMYTVTSPAVFDSEVYRRTRGMGPFIPVVNRALHRRNLFRGLDAAPPVAGDAVLAVLDGAAPQAVAGIAWLEAAGIDRSTPFRGLGVLPYIAAARRLAEETAGPVALYRPMTKRFTPSGGGTMQPEVNRFGQGIGFALSGWVPRPRPPRTTMAGRFCRVEPLDAERHAAQLFAANSEDREGRNFTYFNYGPFATLVEYHDWVAAAAGRSDPLAHAIVDIGRDQAVGVCNYANIQPAIGSIEVAGLVFSPLLQRKPAATEAMYLMMRRAFDELGYRRYEWKCHSLNTPSRVAAARLGFQYEGLFRQATITKGHNRDTCWFSIIDSEWPALRAAFEAWLDPANFDAAGRQRRSLASFRE